MNKVVYITGGSKGIGRSIAEAVLEEGYLVAISGRSESIHEVAKELEAKFPEKILSVVSNVRNYTDEQSAINQVIQKWGRVDVLIANAGVGHFAPIDEMTLEQWNDVIDINLTGVFHSLKASVEQLKANKGYFISIASLAGTNFFAKGTAYNASKYGLVGFTQAAMMDLRQYEVKTTTIMPGSVATYFNGNIPSEKDDWKIQGEDLGQIVVDVLKMPARTLPSKIEVRPSFPHKK